MNKFILISFLMVFLFSGCIHRHFIDQNSTLNKVNKINTLLKGKHCQIKFPDDSFVKAENVFITLDSVTFDSEEYGGNHRLHLTKITRILYRNKKRGAKQGLKYGLIGGGLVGIPLGLGIQFISSCNGEKEGLAFYEAIPLGIFIGGMEWGIIGYSLGRINGGLDVIEIRIEKHDKNNED